MKRLLLTLICSIYFCTYASNTFFVKDLERRQVVSSEIIKSLAAENYDLVSKKFHPSLKYELTTEKISNVWQSVVSKLGSFVEIVSISNSEFQGYQQIRSRCRFEEGNMTVEVTFNAEDLVIGLYIKP